MQPKSPKAFSFVVSKTPFISDHPTVLEIEDNFNFYHNHLSSFKFKVVRFKVI
jgi:hypothetical protein